MNDRDEQRVIEALQALTGGLTVTEQDMITAGGRLKDRLEPPAPRRRLALLAAVAAAVLVAGFVAFQTIDGKQDSAPPADTPTPADTLQEALQADAYTLTQDEFIAGTPPTMADLAGFWLLRAPYEFAMFVDADGFYRMGNPTAPTTHGTSTLVGDTWKRRFDDRAACAKGNGLEGTTQSWRAALAADGSLRMQLMSSDPTCTPADTREVWDRIAPGAPVADYLLAMSEEIEWQAVPASFDLQSLYVAPETGHVLEVTDEPTYLYYETLTDAPLAAAGEGQIEIDVAEGRLTGTCAGGTFSGDLEVGQIPGVEGYVLPYAAIRITYTADSCTSGIADQSVWVSVFSGRSETSVAVE